MIWQKFQLIDLKLNTHTLDAEWETLHSDKRTISLGISGMYQNNQNIFGTQRLPFIPNFVNLSGGAFAVSKLFLNQWTIDLGTRYDYRYYDVKGFDYKNTRYASSFSFNNISASAGATVTLPEKSNVESKPKQCMEATSRGRVV